MGSPHDGVRALVGHRVEVLSEWPEERNQHDNERRRADERGHGARQR
jgi:hypothetical protein